MGVLCRNAEGAAGLTEAPAQALADSFADSLAASFADPFGTNRVSACSRDMPLVSGTLNMTKKNDAAANSAYMAYVSGREAAAITGKLRVMAKLAIHCAAAARPRARARIRDGKISPSSTHTSGPQEAPKLMTKTLAATSAAGPQPPGRVMFSPEPVAEPKARAMVASEAAMPMEPASMMGRRPIRSTSAMATRVTRMLVIAVATEIVSESFSWKPTAFQSVVE